MQLAGAGVSSLEKQQVDWSSFGACVAIILVVCLPLAAFPDSGGKIILQWYDFIATEMGFMYLLAGSAAIVVLTWLAIGRFGKVLLGEPGDRPEFSDLSWAAMLFCAGVGAGLLAWAPIEWAYYIDAPPFGAAPRSPEAMAWASTYGIFHWGPTAWCFYCLPTLAIAYPYYAKGVPYLRFSTAFHFLMNGKEETLWGRAIDLLFMIALLGGAGSSLGFSTPLIATCISRLTGIENDFGLEFLTVAVCVALFSTSVWLGLKKGIKRLSDFNMVIALILLLFVIVVGPTVFLFKTSVNSVGLMLQNFVQMNTWTDAFTSSGFVESWTIFYWAWWIAYGPFVGLFVTRISRGRTIRQVIVGMIGYGTIGGSLFYMVLGNYSLYLELNEILAVSTLLNAQGAPAAIVATLDQLPFGGLAIAAFCLVSIVFTATTYDSASYTLASSATRRLLAGEDPARWHRVFWAVALAVLPLTLMFIGGLKVLQTAALVVSLPILIVGVLMSYCLVKQLAKDHDT
jgi:BCCT family betaine/carnitine transporter